jgi:hypothetical protein
VPPRSMPMVRRLFCTLGTGVEFSGLIKTEPPSELLPA